MNPESTMIAATLAQISEYIRPVIFGHQKCSREEPHDRATDHDEVEVRHDEIRVVDVDVDAQGSRDKARQPTDKEQSEEGNRPDHRRLEPDRAFTSSPSS